MAASDPFQTLGVTPQATADDVRAARRRLAKRLHPDRGGDARRMQELNAAAADALAAIDAGGRARQRGRRPEPRPAPQREHAAPRPPSPSTPPRRSAGAGHGRRPTDGARDEFRAPWRVAEDVPSFVIEALPQDAFGLLSATAPAVGRVLDTDPPYVLDVRVDDPLRCWCRLELQPEGAATAVNLYIGKLGDVAGSTHEAAGRAPFPDIDEVRDAWIAALNAAEWPPPS